MYAQGEEHLFGHSVAELCKKAIAYDNEFENIKRASVLDKYYIPTRYPDGLPGGVPYEMFDEDDASKAIGLAVSVIELVRKKLNR